MGSGSQTSSSEGRWRGGRDVGCGYFLKMHQLALYISFYSLVSIETITRGTDNFVISNSNIGDLVQPN